MFKYLTKTAASFLLLCFTIGTASAQLYLDFGKRTTYSDHYHFKGGQDAGFLTMGTFYGSHHDDLDIGLDRDDMHAVSETEIENGHFLARFDAHGRYVKHTYFHTGKNSIIHNIALDTNYFYILMEIEDSLKVFKDPAYLTTTKKMALLKFNMDLELVKSVYFENDTITQWEVHLGGSKVLVKGTYFTDIDLTIQGKKVAIPYPQPDYNYGHVLLNFDKALDFKNHGTIKNIKSTFIRKIHISSTNQVSIALYTDRSTDLMYGNDTIKKDLSLNWSKNPAVLWLDNNLNLKRYWAEGMEWIIDFDYASFNNNGNFTCTYNMQGYPSSNITRIQLRDSTGKLIRNLDAPRGNSSKLFNTAEAVGDYFAISSSNYTWDFGDTSVFTNLLHRVLVTADSLKFVEASPMGNDYIKSIESQGEDFVFGELSVGFQVTIDTLNGKLPAYKVGSILSTPTVYYGVYKYTKQCIPVTASLAFDSMINCADEVGMFHEQRGSMQVKYKGTGASFQWYKGPNFDIPLNDQTTTHQAGINQIGTQTNVLTRTFASHEYSLNKYLVRVNGACTEPFFTDTIYRQVWGKPLIYPFVHNVKAEVGDTVEIKTYLLDPDYPKDSLIYQWFKGNSALQEGNKYTNTNKENLTINKVTVFDGVTYSCQVTRVHCKDWSDLKKANVKLEVENTIGLANIEKVPFSIFPNPTRNEARIEMNIPYTGTVTFTNALGQKFETPCLENKINTEQFSAGIYFLSFENNGFYYTSKLIIE